MEVAVLDICVVRKVFNSHAPARRAGEGEAAGWSDQTIVQWMLSLNAAKKGKLLGVCPCSVRPVTPQGWFHVLAQPALAYSTLGPLPGFAARLNSASAMAHDEKHCLKQWKALHTLVSDSTCQLFSSITGQIKAHHTQHWEAGSAWSSTHDNKSPMPELTLGLVTHHNLQFMLLLGKWPWVMNYLLVKAWC